MTQPFGIFIQCYKQPYATYEALKSAREHYPEATIIVVSDNGYDYTEMASHFNCTYIHETESISPTYTELESGYHIIHANNLIKRLLKVFQLFKEEYIMWLEDDVSINSKITDMFRYDINGFCPNIFPIQKVKDKYPFLSEDVVYRFSGHGGSVYHKDNMINYFQNKETIDDILLHWLDYGFPVTICVDFLCSSIALLSKGTVGSYNGHCDGYDGINNGIIIQHQYKKFYNLPLPEHIKPLVVLEK